MRAVFPAAHRRSNPFATTTSRDHVAGIIADYLGPREWRIRPPSNTHPRLVAFSPTRIQADRKLGIHLYLDGTSTSAVTIDTSKFGRHEVNYVVAGSDRPQRNINENRDRLGTQQTTIPHR
jgi:hypothetical protein